MIRQERVDTTQGSLARITFELPKGTWAETVHLVGDFNSWSEKSHPFLRHRDGTWSIAVDLPSGRPYRFRYLVDGQTWLTDGQGESGEGLDLAFLVRPLGPQPQPAQAFAPAERPARATARRHVTAAQPAAGVPV
jgi:hypothetical protein